MDPAAAEKPERLTWAEICKRYVDQFVVLVDFDPYDRTLACEYVVFACAPTRQEARVFAKEATAKYRGTALWWTGPIRAKMPSIFLNLPK